MSTCESIFASTPESTLMSTISRSERESQFNGKSRMGGVQIRVAMINSYDLIWVSWSPDAESFYM